MQRQVPAVPPRRRAALRRLRQAGQGGWAAGRDHQGGTLGRQRLAEPGAPGRTRASILGYVSLVATGHLSLLAQDRSE